MKRNYSAKVYLNSSADRVKKKTIAVQKENKKTEKVKEMIELIKLPDLNVDKFRSRTISQTLLPLRSGMTLQIDKRKRSQVSNSSMSKLPPREKSENGSTGSYLLRK